MGYMITLSLDDQFFISSSQMEQSAFIEERLWLKIGHVKKLEKFNNIRAIKL